MRADAPRGAPALPGDAAVAARASEAAAGAANAAADAPSAEPTVRELRIQSSDEVQPISSGATSATTRAGVHPGAAGDSAAARATKCKASGRLLQLAQQLQQGETLDFSFALSSLDMAARRTTGRRTTAGPDSGRRHTLPYAVLQSLPIFSFSLPRLCLSFCRHPSLPFFHPAVARPSCLSFSRISCPAASLSSLFPRLFHAASSSSSAAAAASAGAYQRAATCCGSSSSALNRSLGGLLAAPAHPLRPSAAAAVSSASLVAQQQHCMSESAAAPRSHSSSSASFIVALDRTCARVSFCASAPCRCVSSSCSTTTLCSLAAARAVATPAASPCFWGRHAVICAPQQRRHHRQQQTRSFTVLTSSFSSPSSSSFSKRTCNSSGPAKCQASSTPQSAVPPTAAAFAPSLAGPQAAWDQEILLEWLPQGQDAATSSHSSGNHRHAAASASATSTSSKFPSPSASALRLDVSASSSTSSAPAAAGASPQTAAAAATLPVAAAAGLPRAAAACRSAAAAGPPLPLVFAGAAVRPAGGSGCLGVRLNRPQQHNALSLHMVLLLKQLLRVVDRDPRCSVLLVQGAGDKAFCAGGDVKRMQSATLHEVQQFFGSEYAMDFLTSQIQKPYVAIWNGFVMGGGVGLSCFAHYRVCTSSTLWAMPESALGLFPDVGVSFFLLSLLEEKFPGLPLYIGLTGVKLNARDLRQFGIATHYVRPEQLQILRSGLQGILGGLDAAAAHEEVQKVLRATAEEDLPPQDLSVVSDEILDGCRKFLSLQHIPRSFKALYATLQREAPRNSFCRSLIKELSGRCPLSCAVWQEMLLRVSGAASGGKEEEATRGGREEDRAAATGGETGSKKRGGMQLLQALEQDFRLVQALGFFHCENFKEGVRAVLISKDRNPRWSPEKVEDLDEDFVESLFSCRDVEQTLERYLIS